ncbi:MAG: polysaccharide deacetylase family protein [Paludibacteraceae bacterium]|nr:polysaccharide deacetylase family protein [Paludibacteraceae bacterium]
MVSWIRNILQRLYPYGIFRTGKDVYLTFDDGPIPEVTPRVLEILDRYGVKATFFMVGENINKHPDVFRQVVEAGHAIGNHTYNHIKGWKYSTGEYLENVRKFPKQTHLFRPPYGKTWIWQRRALVKMEYKIILWDVLTRDYNPKRTPEAMLSQIKRETRPGSIINFHDSIKSNERMLAVLPQAIEWLQAQGYELAHLKISNLG